MTKFSTIPSQCKLKKAKGHTKRFKGIMVGVNVFKNCSKYSILKLNSAKPENPFGEYVHVQFAGLYWGPGYIRLRRPPHSWLPLSEFQRVCFCYTLRKIDMYTHIIRIVLVYLNSIQNLERTEAKLKLG